MTATFAISENLDNLMFLDTDVLIWGLRQDPNAVTLLDSLEDIRLSAVVHMELLQGARDKREQQSILNALEEMGVAIVPLNESISEIATEFVKAYSMSHSLYLADALIAATAVHHQQPLISANDKHYRVIPDLTLQVFRSSAAG